MQKFLLGLLTGVVFIVLSLIILAFSAVRLGPPKPQVPDSATLVLKLEGDLPEKAPVSFNIPFLTGAPELTVREIWSGLHRAAGDKRVQALMIEIGRVDGGWAKMNEIRDDILAFRKSGKPVYAYVRSPGMREYYVATAADRIYAAPEDMVDVKGIRAELMYFRNALDKLGVQVEVAHVGRFKDAGDMFTETSMSPTTKESLGLLLDGIYGHAVRSIAEGRGKTPEQIRGIIDNGPYTSSQAHRAGLIDLLRYEDQAYGELERKTGSKDLKKISFRNYLAGTADQGSGGKRIAYVVGDGAITRGESYDAMGTDAGFSSGSFIRMLRRVRDDKSIDGVVLRIDSPGGDAFASDEILREVRLLREKKPMVISMSDYAASGGYYVAMSGDPILAYPGTVTGSIGVVFAKPNFRGLYDKLGIRKDFLLRGKNADIDTDYGPLSPEGKKKLQEGLDEVYSRFVTVVSQGRKRSYNDVEPLAQGRVWLGVHAKERGLVDRLGGLDAALGAIRKRAGMKDDEKVELVAYPPRRTLLQQLMQSREEAFSAEGAAEAAAGERVARWLGVDVRALVQSGYLHMLPFQLSLR